MKARAEFEITLDAAGGHGHDWILTIRAEAGGHVSLSVRNPAGAVQCHGQERGADFARMAQTLAVLK